MPWSVLQSAGAPAASSTTASVSFTINLSAGSKILCYIANNLPVTGVKDTAGNSLTQIFDVANTWSAVTGHLTVYAMDTPAGDVGGTTTITVTVGTPSFFGVLIQEVSGLLAGVTGLIDGTADSVVQTTLPNTSPAYSSSAVNEFLVGFLGDNGLGITGPAATGYTIDPKFVSGTDCDCVIGYKNSTDGAESCVYTQTGGTNAPSHAVALFAIKLAVSDVTASGAVTMAAMAVAGTGAATMDVTATGAVTMAAMTVAGTGSESGSNVTASGAVMMAAMRVAGAGPPAYGNLAVFIAAGAC